MHWKPLISRRDDKVLPTRKEMMFDVAAEVLRWAMGIGAFLLGWHFLSCALDMIVR